MKLKEYIEQLQKLDPELEIYKKGMYSYQCHPLESTSLLFDVGFTSDTNNQTFYYSEFELFNKKVLILD